jgi:hypothetical protein
MIVKTMSDGEIIKELKSIENILDSRITGYMKKFEKKLKSKAYRHNDVLGVQEYVINWNRVLICFQKLAYTDKFLDVRVNYIVITEDNGAFLSFRDRREDFGFYHYSKHSIDRMWERMGLTIKDFFVNEYVTKANVTHHLTKYNEDGNDDSTYIMAIGRCFFIVCIVGNKIVVKTTLDLDRIRPNQMTLYADSKELAEKYADQINQKIVGRLKGNEFRKKGDAINTICA